MPSCVSYVTAGQSPMCMWYTPACDSLAIGYVARPSDELNTYMALWSMSLAGQSPMRV